MNKIKNTVFQIMIFISVGISFFSCKKQSITDPVNNLPEEKYDPGRRDYNWKLDTLEMPMNLIDALWGSSPSDVWVVGGGSDEEHILWHFDGNSWKLYYNPSFSSGYTLFGFSQNNVWMGCSNGEIWHFDGNQWSLFFDYYVEGSYLLDIENIWGFRPNDVYACGNIVYSSDGKKMTGFILHFDGITWKEICRGEADFYLLQLRNEQNSIYVAGYKPDFNNGYGSIISFYKLIGNGLKRIYADSLRNIGWGNFNLLKDKLYFNLNKNLFAYKSLDINSNDRFVKILSINEPKYAYYFFGRNPSDIFLSMYDGLAHYNGSDIQYILRFPETSILIGGLPVIFDKEIFCGIYDNTIGKNLVLHGKLKE